jgi:hypothetical protein
MCLGSFWYHYNVRNIKAHSGFYENNLTISVQNLDTKCLKIIHVKIVTINTIFLWIVVFWAVTLVDCTASQPRRLQFTFSLPWKPEISCTIFFLNDLPIEFMFDARFLLHVFNMEGVVYLSSYGIQSVIRAVLMKVKHDSL